MKVKARDEQFWSNCGMIQGTWDDFILSVALGNKKYSENRPLNHFLQHKSHIQIWESNSDNLGGNQVL
jgi:hypothetical protein